MVKTEDGARRTYRMRKRHDDMEETRQRIVDAAVKLHGTVGPVHTTFSAVAEEAGVQRSTVYRHFADETALFGACTSHWLASHPWPRPQDWEHLTNPEERLRRGLKDLYQYYDTNQQMLTNSFRDIDVMPPFVAEMMGAVMQSLMGVLVAAWPEAKRTARLTAAIRGAMDFRTSRAFVDSGLTPGEAADLVTDMVARIA